MKFKKYIYKLSKKTTIQINFFRIPRNVFYAKLGRKNLGFPTSRKLLRPIHKFS